MLPPDEVILNSESVGLTDYRTGAAIARSEATRQPCRAMLEMLLVDRRPAR
jgi:hypothetical protein